MQTRNLPSRQQWVRARAQYEAGAKIRVIAGDLGVTQSAVKMRIKREGWKRPDLPESTAAERVLPGAGRVSTLRSAELADSIVELVALGGSLRLAAQYTGIANSTLQDWIDSDPEFGRRIEQARAAAPRRNLARMDKHAEHDWRAAAHVLAHHPLTREDWAHQPTQGGARVEVVIRFDRDATATTESITIEGSAT